MGLRGKHGRVTTSKEVPRSDNDTKKDDDKTRPELVRKRQNRNSTFRMGRTIGEQREKLETKNERNAARKKDKKRQIRRVVLTVIGFVILIGVLIFLCFFFVSSKESSSAPLPVEDAPVSAQSTVEIVDEDAASGGKITNRMRAYVGQAEQDFRDLGYKPTKVVVPTGSIREVDFYIEGYSGFIKLYIDRDTAVSVEDADRMLHYLAGQGINEFQYIDVRLAGRAYWK